jgi:hypothetical protein
MYNLQKEMEYLDDLENELELADEDEMLRYFSLRVFPLMTVEYGSYIVSLS